MAKKKHSKPTKLRESSRIRKYKIATSLRNQIRRVNKFKKTNILDYECRKIDVPDLCYYYNKFKTSIKKEDKKIYRQIDSYQNRVLHGYNSIKDYLLSLIDYDKLKLPYSNYRRIYVLDILRKYVKLLFEHITFVKAGGKETDKVFAVIAGSFPAYLAGYVKEYNDIDIFLAINTSDPQTKDAAQLIVSIVSKVAHFTHRRYSVDYKDDINIYTIATIGKLQFIVKDYNGCYKHINDTFFNAFHHAT